MIWRQEELSLPPRKRKPRASGLTVVIVNGAPTGYFEDVVASASDHIDMVKFGWGTALVTADLERKIAWLRAHEVEYFFGDQVVCHRSDKIAPKPEMYPRHFGVTFCDRSDHDDLLRLVCERKLPFFREPFTRFKGMVEEHQTFFLVDPSNNLLEFKWYRDAHMMY